MYHIRIVKFAAIAVLLLSFFLFSTCSAQTIRDIFPDKDVKIFDFESHFPSEVLSNRSILGLTEDQQKTLKDVYFKIARAETKASLLRTQLKSDYKGPSQEEFNRMHWAEMMSMMDETQLVRFTQFNLVRYVGRLSELEWDGHSDVFPPLQQFVFCEPFAKWLGVSDEQQRALQNAKREAEEAIKEFESKGEETIKEFGLDSTGIDSPAVVLEPRLFIEWQSALYELLLPHQQSKFNETFGEPAAFLKSFFNKVFTPRFFLRDPVDLNYGHSFQTGEHLPPELGHLLNLTHPHLDAKIHPHALFDFLLETNVSKDLKIDALQTEQITRLRNEWFEENPRPRQIEIEIEKGRKMTTRAMRAAAEEFKQEFGHYHDQVDRILSPKQQERLRQLGNQFLMSRGWLEVPLTCPEWVEYLELTQTQRAEFNRVNEKFRYRHERIEWEFEEIFRNIERDLEDKISRILTAKQKETILQFIAIRGY